MKHAFTKGLFVAATATLIAACSTDDAADQMPVAPGKIEVSLKAALPQSRAQIEVDESNGRFSGSWEATDELTVHAEGSQTGEETQKFTYDASSKVFKGQLTEKKQDWTYQAVYPAVDATPLNIPFGAERTQKGSNFNGAYDPLVSALVTHDGAEPGKTPQGEAVTFGLKRLTAILALTFKTDDATFKAEKVKSVALTAAGKTIAAKSFDITLDDQSGALNTDGQSETITLSYEAGSEPAAASFKAYFNVPAATYGKLSVVITTEGHTASLDLTTDGIELLPGELAYTTKAVSGWTALEPIPDAPTMEWTENPDFAETPIENGMQVHVKLKAPAGIKVFGITINSATLVPIVTDPSTGFGFTVDGENSASIDLVQTPNAILMELLGLKDIDLTNATEIPLDLSQLIPMIKLIGAPEGSKHIFTLKLIDKNDQPLEKALTFYIPMAAVEPSATFSDIDLWANTAKITLTDAPEGAKVQYKRADEQIKEWNTLTPENDGSFLIKTPTWTKSQNDAGLDIYTVNPNEGIFANTTYKWQIINTEQIVIASGEYTTATGDAIPNAGMDNWTTFEVAGGTFTEGTVNCANASADNMFWASGNNKQVPNLCTEATGITGAKNSCAKLQGGRPSIADIFAPGNLFSGTMEFASGFGMYGYADFGQKFTYTARPSAIKVRIKGSVNTIQKIGSNDPQKDNISLGKTIDPIRVFICITNWDTRHRVQSGVQLEASTFWDPTQKVNPGEGNIIAYAERTFTESINNWTDITIPLCFYDKDATIPAADKYSFVFSAAASARGDYLTGCYENELYIDNIEWVY